MKRLLLIIVLLVALGCATTKEPPKTDYFREAEKAGLNIDTDSNNAVDIVYGGLNRTSICASGELIISDGTDYDCLGSTPAGDLGGTWSNPSVDNDSHTHIPSNITSITEGYIIVGNASNVGAATDQLPNLTTTILLTTDDTWSSGKTKTANSSGAITQWAPVYLTTSNQWAYADADATPPTQRAWGIATATTTGVESLVVMQSGTFRNDAFYSADISNNTLLYLSETPCCGDTTCTGTPFDCYGWTDTPTTTTGEVVQPLGIYLDDGSSKAYIDLDVNHVHGWATVP